MGADRVCAWLVLILGVGLALYLLWLRFVVHCPLCGARCDRIGASDRCRRCGRIWPPDAAPRG